MRYSILALCLFGVVQTFSSKSAAQGTDKAQIATVKKDATPGYKTLTDTIVPAASMSKATEVLVLSQVNAHWSIIQRGKAELYVHTNQLTFTGKEASVPVGPAAGTTVKLAAPAVYAVARTTNTFLKLTSRLLILDEGVKLPALQPYYKGTSDKPMVFETEAVVLNFLDSLGWIVMDSRQEIVPDSKQVYYDVVYILKRK